MPTLTQHTNTPSSPTNLTLPPLKRLKLPIPDIPKDLGEYISRDTSLIQAMGWDQFVKHRRPQSDFSSLQINHPARQLLKHYRDHGVPIQLTSPPWSQQKLQHALHRGPHKSSYEYLDFLEYEFVDMIQKGQWVVIPFSLAKNLPGLRLSPPPQLSRSSPPTRPQTTMDL